MENMRVVLLGLGMQGKPALYDLLRWKPALITVVDQSPACEKYVRELNSDIVRAVRLDVVSEPDAVVDVMAKADIVVDLLPATLTFRAAELAVKAGTSIVSTSYLRYPDETDPVRAAQQISAIERLSTEAKAKNIVILPEFGLDPGIDLVLAAQAARELDEITELYSYGAGLPELSVADNPLRYKFSWSVEGVLHSYQRAARVLKDGKEIVIDAEDVFERCNIHHLDLPEMGGRLECFMNGDAIWYAEMLGLDKTIRSTARYTCRWPGHSDFWNTAVRCGLLSRDKVQVGAVEVSPVDVLGAVLSKQEQFHLAADERDVVLVRVDARGMLKGKKTRIVYQLVAWRDLETGFLGMGRTVGFPVSIAARMVAGGDIVGPGVVWPHEVPFALYVKELEALGLVVGRCQTIWQGDEVTA